MAKYILLGTLTDEGAEKLRKHPEWINEVKGELAETGVKVVDQYAVLGQYDLVYIVEAPDNRSVVHASAQLTMRGSLKVTTLPAVPLQEFIDNLT